MAEHKPKSRHIYLSLGDKEEKVRSQILRTVGDKIREVYTELITQNVDCVLEWNQGNHFRETDLRTARGFAWLVESVSGDGSA